MVAHQQRRALRRNVFVATHLEAVDHACDDEGDEAQQVFRHQHEDVERHHRVEQAGNQEHLRDREVGTQQRAHAERADDHEKRVQDVVGRDDAGAVARLRTQLDQRVHRHAVQAGEQRQQRQVGHHAPVRGHGEERAQRVAGRWREAARREVQVDREHAHADRAHRHQADLDMALAQHLAQQRAGADADREHHQQQ